MDDAEKTFGSPFNFTSFQTPLLNFRPRKFSSPFPIGPLRDFKDEVGKTSLDDKSTLLFADSGIEVTISDYDVSKSCLCPKYHNEGICELGPSCPLVHEPRANHKKVSLFDPLAPEFVPRLSHNTSQSWKGMEEDSIARDLTSLALRHSNAPADYTSLLSDNNEFLNYFDHRSQESAVTSQSSLHNYFCDVKQTSNPSCCLETRRYINLSKFKTEPCTTFHTIGSCPYGDECNFYHQQEEKNTSRLKTRLCKTWCSGGKCSYGLNCDFAHGKEELNVKFKTRLCKVFLATGRCPYGAQCTFAHNEVERRKDISTLYKFKTEICQLWLNDKCSFGKLCHFAHGVHELQKE